MAQSKQVALRAAVAALLLAGTPLASGNVLQNRNYVLPQGVAAQIHVDATGSEFLELHLGNDSPRDWDTEIELRILARKSASVEASDVADALWVDAYGRVLADPTLGGLVWQLEPGDMTSDPDEADTSVCRLIWRFTVKHRTTNNSISA